MTTSEHTPADKPTAAEPRGRWAAYTASTGAIVYGLPHLWWGMGVSATFPGDFEAATSSSTGSAAIGYWGFGILSILAAAGPPALVQRWGRVFPRWLVLIPAWTVSAALALWGLGYFYLRYFLAVGRVESAGAFAAQDAHPQADWGLLWYADFLVTGIALGVATWHYQRRSARG
ncbi:hypothetical protein ACRAKI_11025 [Saccharothrix isguenensis]